MDKAFAGGVALLFLGLTAPAGAADLAPYTKAPGPMITPVYDWSGFYVGINGGGGSSRNCWDLVGAAGGPTREGCHNATGGTVGGLFGYRWQSMNWVFGVEAQGNWADFSGDNVSTPIPAQRNRSRLEAFGLFTGQVGYVWNSTLLYVKGGAAVVDDRYGIFIAPGFPGAGTQLADTGDQGMWGGTVGAGLEFGFAPNWSVGVEYDHLFLGNRAFQLTTTPGGLGFQTDRISQGVDMGLVRVNYKFGPTSLSKY